jgi:recombination protein RecT
MVELAMRSGALSTIYAEPVYESDKWEYQRGTDPKLIHVPAVFSSDRGKLLGVYAFAKFKDGADASTVMSKADIDGIKNRSRASGSGPWVTDYVEMAKKTVLRRLCKTLPLSPEFRETMQRDITTEYGTEDEPEPVKRKSAFAVHDAEVVDSDGQPDDALPDEPAGNPEDAVE